MTARKDRAEPSLLLAAAEAFDAALERFAHLTEAARHGNLSSQKALERAAESLQEIADCEEQMQAHARGLMAALGAAREQQEKQAALAAQRAEEVRERTAVYGDLLKRFQALGTEAAELNAMGQGLSARKPDGGAATTGDQTGTLGGFPDPPAKDSARQAELRPRAEIARDPAFASGLRDLSQRMGEVADHAQGLTTAARDADFEDVARQAESLRQQLLAARNKVSLLHGSLAAN